MCRPLHKGRSLLGARRHGEAPYGRKHAGVGKSRVRGDDRVGDEMVNGLIE